MKKLIKKFLSYKLLKIKEKGKNCFIHPNTSIKIQKNLILGDNSIIRSGVRIAIDSKGKLILERDNQINTDTNIFIKCGTLKMKANSYLNNNCTVIGIGDILIGENVMIGPCCNIISGNHNYSNKDIPYILQGDNEGTIIIEDNVWIGANVTLLPNITISENSVIAAGSVVTKSIPSNEIWGGNPAKFIKKI